MRNKILGVFISLMCLVYGFAHQAHATQTGDWYVAMTGNDENLCNTIQSPCKTINAALNKVLFQPGDTILIDSGYYTSTQEIVVTAITDAILSGGWEGTFTTQNGYTFVAGDQSSILIKPGVTIQMDRMILYGANDSALINQGILLIDEVIAGGAPYGIENQGIAILSNGYLDNSSGAGISNSGNMEISETIVRSNDGSGIVNSGVMTLTNSVVSDHTNWFSSGVINHGTITIRDTAIVQNIVIYLTSGTGLYNTGYATLVNTTISGNAGGTAGTIYNASGAEVHLFNSSVSYNISNSGSGIFNAPGGIVTLQNTILGQNGTYGNDNCFGDPIQSLGYNLIEDTTGCTILPGPGDLLDVSALVFPVQGYARLGPPANEEQRFTPLAFSSPAVNGGNPAGCVDDQGNPILTDQRGLPRTGACDIGAYEYIAAFDPLQYFWLPVMLQFPP